MEIPHYIKDGDLDTQVTWLAENFHHHTWNSRDNQPFHLAEFFAQDDSGEWINLSVLNSGDKFVKAVISAITQKQNKT